jgi:hypothetical protein
MDEREMARLGEAVLKAAAQHHGDSAIGQVAKSVLDGEISLAGLARLPFVADELGQGLREGVEKRADFASDPMVRRLVSGTPDGEQD